MNGDTLFSSALGLHTPWQAKDVTFPTDELTRSKLHLLVDYVTGSRFLDESKEHCPVGDTINRQWQHLSFLSTPFASITRCRALIKLMW